MIEAPPMKPRRRRFFRNDNIGLVLIEQMVDTSVGRVFIKRPAMGSIEVLYFDQGQQPNAYQTWLALPKGTHAAMRNAGDKTPLYHHDFVDAR